MTDEKDIKQFPDLSNKLATAPTKKSLFERQKAEAEAKRIREEAETAAVYEDFVKSFEDDGDAKGSEESSRAPDLHGPPPSGPKVGGASRRHFVPPGQTRSSGPGTLGPAPTLSKKRALDEAKAQQSVKERGMFAFEDAIGQGPVDPSAAFKTSDDEEDKRDNDAASAASKPTLQLTQLPPGTSPAVVKSLVPSTLSVDAVRIVPPQGPGSSAATGRKSTTAIVTLAQETPASQIDLAVNSLQNRYLGWGYYLSLSRHLSSAALGSNMSNSSFLKSSQNNLPFGARQPPQNHSGSLSRAPPPPSHRGGFAPPPSYSNTGRSGTNAARVNVEPPTSVSQLKLIHKTVEAMLTHGPEFEALLMSRPDVQRDENWAWIWDSRSVGGVWYRWRLWQILTRIETSKRPKHTMIDPPSHRLFDGGAPWVEPEQELEFEFATKFDELVFDPDYDSSQDEDSEEESEGPRKRRRFGYGASAGQAGAAALNNESEENRYLNPLHKAKLSHLLFRLPITTARLRKGDVARVTSFAITHAGTGAEEVVDMLVSNVLRPFTLRRSAVSDEKDNENTGDMTGQDQSTTDITQLTDRDADRKDPSSSIMIGLHLVSDILSASSTSGVRHAWRYRTLFEQALIKHNVFAKLGRLEKEYNWGRLRSEKWRRSVQNTLQLWEGWCVFPANVQETLVETFNNPPLTKDEEEEKAKEQKDKKTRDLAKSKWRSVEVNAEANKAGSSSTPEVGQSTAEMEVDGEPIAEADIEGQALGDEPVDGEPLADVDGEPMGDLDGEPVADDLDGEPVPESMPGNQEVEVEMKEQDGQNESTEKREGVKIQTTSASRAAEARKRRPKAEDMFASDDE
ncbi:MAG: hypothetical protein M1831_005671 [Alyxoria varia]|nr:MAG: hypothetical protein M1831_005671 [Alyxoria varia]